MRSLRAPGPKQKILLLFWLSPAGPGKQTPEVAGHKRWPWGGVLKTGPGALERLARVKREVGGGAAGSWHPTNRLPAQPGESLGNGPARLECVRAP